MQELYVDSVNHYYGHHNVLNSVYINCKRGEIVGLLGRNGSGKSTLMKIIYGHIKPHFMHLKLNDELVKKGYLTDQINYLPQNFFIPKYMRIIDLVSLYTNLYRTKLLAVKVINDNLDQKIGNLSGGERRLVECLLIIYSDHPYLLLDEPFSQISPVIITEIQGHLLSFKALKGFIITDHYYQQILAISTRIVLLHNGCNYSINSIEDLRLHNYLPA